MDSPPLSGLIYGYEDAAGRPESGVVRGVDESSVPVYRLSCGGIRQYELLRGPLALFGVRSRH